MQLYDSLVNKQDKLSVIGLGYVGLPIAIAFARKLTVIGYDVNPAKIDLSKRGIDPTREVGDDAVASTTAEFTSDESRLRDARFHIVAVPTPINPDRTPNLDAVKAASRSVGRNLCRGSVVVYESTVYPGVTEDICVPILEEESGLRCGVDFKVGYSPERINPGDKEHRLETIVKVVSGMDEESLETIAKVYELVVEAGVFRAESIRVAEAAKVIENAQRDINIAFMNELSIIFNLLGIDTRAVLEAASTKWNFIRFTPGLVGGHCIGVDPYYLTYKAQEVGYHSQVVLAGREINDSMGKYVAENTIKTMIKANRLVNRSRVAIFGITFKENCPDARNTKVIDIVRELNEYGVQTLVVDPVADEDEVRREYGIDLCRQEDAHDVDAVIVAVPHEEFRNELTLERINTMYRVAEIQYDSNTVSPCEAAATSDSLPNSCKQGRVLIDVKGMFDRIEAESMGFLYWRL